MTRWPRARLGDLLVQRNDVVAVDPTAEYPMAGVYSFGRGLFLRGVLPGQETSYKEFYRVHSGDLVLSRVKGWEGAIGVVPEELDGHYVSKEFPVFTAQEPDIINLAFLNLYFQTKAGRESLARAAKGIGARRERVKEAEFVQIEVPLPPVAAQEAAVRRHERVNAASSRAIGLRQRALSELSELLDSVEFRLWADESLAGAPMLADVTTFLARGRQSRQGPSEHVLIKTQHVQMGRLLPSDITLSPAAASQVQEDAKLLPDDVLIACSAAGCLGRVARFTGPAIDASTDTHVAIARPDPEQVLPEYLYAYLRGAQGQRQLRSRERGDWKREKVGFRLTELNLQDLRKVPVPLPTKAQQAMICGHVRRVRGLAAQLGNTMVQVKREIESAQRALVMECFEE